MVLSVWNRLLMKFIKGKPIPSWSNHHGHRGHQQKGIRPDSASAEDQMLARGWRSTCGLHQYGDGLKLELSMALREISHCLENRSAFSWHCEILQTPADSFNWSLLLLLFCGYANIICHLEVPKLG